ncbi:MAG TPA: sugar phosphate isomerase/epimerase [Opitutus sp.]|nr:sugar phosphate isomerase/epimerase [Opitutus sp.]
MTTRRTFIKTTAGALGATALLGRFPARLAATTGTERTFGFQSWTLREELARDLPGTLKKMAALGYAAVEFCSPHGYTGTPFEKFRSLSGTELRGIIADSGLKCESSHFNMTELREDLDARIAWAHEMGLTQMITSSFWLPKEATIDDYRRSCDQQNAIAARIHAAGMQSGFHNHNMEFEKQNGELIYDALLERLDPKLVKMQFQVAVIELGYKAADFFRKHPGRFISSHLADWSAQDHRQVPIGQGDVDWKDFFDAAQVGGVKNVFVEMAPEFFPDSARFLKTI